MIYKDVILVHENINKAIVESIYSSKHYKWKLYVALNVSWITFVKALIISERLKIDFLVHLMFNGNSIWHPTQVSSPINGKSEGSGL